MSCRVVAARVSSVLLLACLAGMPTGATAGADVLLRGATVHVGDGSPPSVADVLVRDGLIAAVGKNLPASPGLPTRDLAGLHLSPGLMLSGSTLGLTEIGAVRSTRDDREVGRVNPHVQSWIAVNPDSEHLDVALSGGITHALISPRGGLMPGRSAVLQLDGWTHEDMSLKAPAALHMNWPGMRLDRGPKAKPKLAKQQENQAASLEEIRRLFEQARVDRATRGAGVAAARDRRPRLEALAPVLSGELPVVVAANDISQMRAAIEWAEAEGVRLILSGGRDAWRIADELAAAEVAVIVSPIRAMPRRDFEPYDSAFMNPVHLHRAGVSFAFNIGGGSNARNLPDEAGMAIAYGLPPEAALAAITSVPARLFGVDDQVGLVAAGLRAHLVAWSGPPLDVRSVPRHVFLDGEDVAGRDRHSRLWRKYRGRPRAPTGLERADGPVLRGVGGGSR
jgi:imidazolonepropionase-like amidohydrolase